MKQECAAVGGFGKRYFARTLCEHCQKETIHQGAKCLICGHYHRMKGSVGPKPIKGQMKRRLVNQARVNRDRRAALAQAAAASREKFEGKS